ncbi:MAG: T9SS type A sorting domain-containing protein [Bacteroidota bacterium]
MSPTTSISDFLMCAIDSVGTKLPWIPCNDNGTDNYLDDYNTINVVVYFTGEPLPTTGDLEITGPRMIGPHSVDVGTLVGLDSFIFDSVTFRCDSVVAHPYAITAAFTDAPSCSVTNDSAGLWWPPGPITSDSYQLFISKQCSVCTPPDGFDPPTAQVPNCWPEESPNTSPCEDSANYGPDPDFPEHTPIKYIKVVLHIFQKENGPPENYDTSHMDIIRSWFTHPDGTNKQWTTGLCPDPGITPVMTDARLRVVNTGTEGYDVFFHKDNDGWMGWPVGGFNKTTYVTNPDSNVVGSEYYWALKDTNILHAHHVFIAHNWGGQRAGGYTFIGSESCNGSSIDNSPTSLIYGSYVNFLELEDDPTQNDTAALGQQVLGEIYHLLGVDHTSPLQAHFLHSDHINSGDGCYDTPLGIDGQTLTGCQISTRCALSQCQIGRMHRFMEKNSPGFERFPTGELDSLGRPIYSRTERNCNLTDADIVIPAGTDVIWTGPRSLRSNVVVKSGAKLTITCDIGMPQGGHFTVEPGAKLTIDGAKIYNNCDGDFWQGIEVQGTPGNNQLPYTSNGQGFLNMLEGSTLQRAELPISVKGGGLARAFSSDFFNCGELYFSPYKPNNFSIFSNCNFTRDSGFDLGEWPDQVQLEEVNRVVFAGCNFNTVYGSGQPNGAAILGWGSSFNVGDCTFEGFRIGVWGFSWWDNLTGSFYVRKCTFKDNRIAIASWGSDNVIVQDNKISGIGNHPEQGTHRGLTLWNCTGYTVTDNTFEGIGSGVSNHVGIWSRNTGSEYNEIKENKFDDLFMANLAEENNSGALIQGGLHYLCNENLIENTHDFLVRDGGISVHQGGDLDAAGNIFSHFNTTVGDFYNLSPDEIKYYHLPVDGHRPLYYEGIGPIEVSDISDNCSAVTDIPIPDTIRHDSPPQDSLVLPPQDKTQMAGLYDSAKKSLDSLYLVYSSLLNGGKMEDSLVMKVLDAKSSDAVALELELAGYSPYLSRPVLEAVATRGDILTDASIENILSGNPDELGGAGLQAYLYDELDTALVDSILLHQGQSTARTTMEASLTGYNMDAYRAAKRIIVSILADSTGLDTAGYRLWLSNKGSVESAYQKAGTYIMARDFSTAKLFRDSIPDLYSLDSAGLAEHGHFVNLTELVMNAMQADIYYADYTPSRVSQVQAIADSSNGVAGTMAQGLLNVFYGYSYLSDPAPLQHAPSERAVYPLQDHTGTVSGLYRPLKALPNPATDKVVFQYDLGEGNGNGRIEVFDVNGKMVRTFDINGQKGRFEWDTAPFARGIYYCRTNTLSGSSVPLKLVLLNQ